MASAGLKAGGIVSVLVIICAILYKRRTEEEEEGGQLQQQAKLNHVLSALLRAERRTSLPGAPRVALGFGGCFDVNVNALRLFDRLGFEPPRRPAHVDSVGRRHDLEQLFAYFFRHGAAAERFVSNATLFEELTNTAESIAGVRWFLGGNAPVMAKRLAHEGARVLLGTAYSRNLQQFLPEGVKIAGPKLDEIDVHLILEYNKSDQWGTYTSPRANRLIVHSDKSNPMLEALEAFKKEFFSFNPSLFVLGGLQMMDNYPFKKGERLGRLTALQNLLSSVSRKTKIHFEMASFTKAALLREILDHVIIYSDSLGMNEQELPNLVSILGDGNITLISDSYPRIATVLDQMRFVFRNLRGTIEKEGRRKLSRLHIHTLAFQAILTAKDSGWKNSMSATAKASLTAHRHVCGSNFINTLKARLIMDDSFLTSKLQPSQRIPFQESRPISCWNEGDFQFCVAPVLVCTEVLKTAGGGDNVSSAGLVLQI